MTTYFHRTDAADAILSEGFRDSTGDYMFATLILTGVWVSDEPLDFQEGAEGDTLLRIDLDADLSNYEVVESVQKSYREWCVPAAVLNAGVVRRCTEDEEDVL